MATESILLDALRIPARYADEVLEAMESKKKEFLPIQALCKTKTDIPYKLLNLK